MFDKINIKALISLEDVETVVMKNYLEECSEGDEIYYKSTAYANLSGMWIEIRGNRLKCKCSIAKLWAKERTGKLDNSRPMTFGMAIRTIKSLLLRLCVKAEDVIVTYYEIGLTMKMSVTAKEVIEQVDEAGGRVLWNDANYPEYRQKTSEKSKYYRKVMKIYDKTYEAAEKGRDVGDKVLRIETIYKHQNIRLSELISRESIEKISRIFYEDWLNLRFNRELRPIGGVKMSQLEKAKEIHKIGIKRYKDKYRELWQNGRLTKKQWETMRIYANRWDEEKRKYTEEEGVVEKEYREKLLKVYQIGKLMPCANKYK